MSGFKDLSKLIKTYNKGLWFGHREDSKLVVENGQIFINGYKNDTCFIIEELKSLLQLVYETILAPHPHG